MNIILFGVPGAGKSTVAKAIVKHFSIPHISTGDIFRDHIKRKTALGKEVESRLAKGELISDELTTQLVEVRLAEDDVKNGYILDGYPRTLAQAQWVDENQHITHYVVFDIEESVVVERLSGRRIHPASGRTYHVLYNPPRVDNIDNETGEQLIQREDDTPDKIKHRLEVYAKQTQVVLDFIKDKPECTHINASQSMDKVLEDTMSILNSAH